MYIFDVTIHYKTGGHSVLTVRADNDLQARAKAVKKDGAQKTVEFCETRFVRKLDE